MIISVFLIDWAIYGQFISKHIKEVISNYSIMFRLISCFSINIYCLRNLNRIDIGRSVARCETRKSGIPISKSGKFRNFFSKIRKNPERFSKVSFDCLRSIFLYLHNIYLNETIENTHQNIINSINKNLSITHFAVNLHVVFSTTFFHYNT